MSTRRIASYGVLGVGLLACLPATGEEPEKHWLEAPGIGVVADIGNNGAATRKVIDEDVVVTDDLKAKSSPAEVASRPRAAADLDNGGRD